MLPVPITVTVAIAGPSLGRGPRVTHCMPPDRCGPEVTPDQGETLAWRLWRASLAPTTGRGGDMVEALRSRLIGAWTLPTHQEVLVHGLAWRDLSTTT